MTLNPWKVLETRHIHPWVRIDKCELSNGDLLNATVFEFGSWANVVALTRQNEVVLVKQYRHGVGDALLEFPGGVIEKDEDITAGIRRELLEETGYQVSRVVPVGKLYPNPALQTNTMYCFLAFDAEKVAEQDLDIGEDIEVHLMPFDELIELTKSNQFPHALDVAVLFQALAYLNRIR